MNTPIQPLARSAVNVQEFCELCGVGRTSFYAAVKRGQIRPVKFGRRTLILVQEVDAFLAGLATGGR